MASGGCRPGAGRPRKNPDAPPKAKKPVGRPKGYKVKQKVAIPPVATSHVEPLPNTPPEAPGQSPAENLLPLEFCLKEMNNPDNTLDYRYKMAALAAPYCHKKSDVKLSKKEERQEKIDNGPKKFASGPAPKVVGRIGK
jgi:hypothetical protein